MEREPGEKEIIRRLLAIHEKNEGFLTGAALVGIKISKTWWQVSEWNMCGEREGEFINNPQVPTWESGGREESCDQRLHTQQGREECGNERRELHVDLWYLRCWRAINGNYQTEGRKSGLRCGIMTTPTQSVDWSWWALDKNSLGHIHFSCIKSQLKPQTVTPAEGFQNPPGC